MRDYPDFCPNCNEPIMFRTESGWHDAQLITEYWRACPNYWKAKWNHDYEEKQKHWAGWISRPWPDVIRTTYEYNHKHIPHLIQRWLGMVRRVDSDRGGFD